MIALLSGAGSLLGGAGNVELVRLAFVVGVAVSLVFYERWNLTTGSVGELGYVAALFFRPASLVATFVVASACHLLVNRAVASRVLIYGRNKFALLAVTSAALIVLARFALMPFDTLSERGSLIGSGGLIVPALIAHHMGRQGVVRTTRTVLLAASLVVGIVLVAGLALDAGIPVPTVATGELAFEQWLVPLAVLFSAVTAWGLQAAFGLRAGGFVGGAYVALLSSNARSVCAVLLVALATYAVVVHLVGRFVILFGRRKFAAMLLCGALFGWWSVTGGAQVVSAGPFEFGALAGFAVLPMFLPALIANDMERVGVQRTLAGLGLSSLVVLGGLRLIELLGSLPAAELLVVVLAAIALGATSAQALRWNRSVSV